MRGKLAKLFLVGLLACSWGITASAEDATDLEKRVQQLEEELKAMKAEKEEAPVAGAPTISTSLPITLYGYFKVDAAYDSTYLFPGNYVLWANSEQTSSNDNKFNLTVNQTRLGLKFDGPDLAGGKSGGVLETDFYGAGAPENKPLWRLRRAFVTIKWPSKVELLAGQEWDLAMPQAPETLNFLPLCFAGNLGYRRPQIRLTKDVDLSDFASLKLQGAAVRSIGTPAGLTDAGADAGYPGAMARVGLSVKRPNGKVFVLGVSGLYATEENDADNTRYNSWFIGADTAMPINKWLTVKGEVFKGQALGSYCGSINYMIGNHTEVGSWGGWAGAAITPIENWRFNVAAGCEDNDAGDLANGSRTYNRVLLANAIRSFGKLEVGVELSRWLTEYKNSADGDGYRVQTSIMYKF